jgi:hypothetical protein
VGDARFGRAPANAHHPFPEDGCIDQRIPPHHVGNTWAPVRDFGEALMHPLLVLRLSPATLFGEAFS